MTKANLTLLKTLAPVIALVAAVRIVMARLGWRGIQVEPRMNLSLILWAIFALYWTLSGRNSAPTQSAESSASTFVHQLLLLISLLLVVLPLPWLKGSIPIDRFRFLAPLGLFIQSASLLFAVWARWHLGRNWSGAVRIAVDHELIRTGPYRFLRHPIYTAMLGMTLGTAIVSGRYQAFLGIAILVLAYLRKTRLEEQALLDNFGAAYEDYRRDTWALVPLLF
jgi:protein-S-isoprenylcysteine O-methyltransferase Ste14